MINKYGWRIVDAYMGFMMELAKRKMREAFSRIEDGTYKFEDSMDDGSKIKAKLTIKGENLIVDFTGSAKVNWESSLNANRVVVMAALIYCLRCLID